MRFLRDEGGQSVVEFALALPPILLILVFGMIEMGTLYTSDMAILSSSREGARMGGSMANGGGPLSCGAGMSPNWTTVDPQIIAAVERALSAKGALIRLSDVQEIRIWKATSAGAETAGLANSWTYALNGGPVIDGQALDFVQVSAPWQACARNNVIPSVDSLGVTVRYTYRGRTPLAFLIPGLATIQVSDRTVMTLNATR